MHRQAPVALLLTLSLSGALACQVDTAAPRQATAKPAGAMEPYTVRLPDCDVTFDMVPIPGGRFSMGSPEDEAGRKADEGPQHSVEIAPFWIGKCEVTWQEYDRWSQRLDMKMVDGKHQGTIPGTDGIARPTPPYTDMTFAMGREGYPAICMTQHAAKTYCEWLSAVTGHTYRLPTEAEWEYACRAGTATAYSFGDDPARLDDYAWHDGNSDGGYAQVGQKKPNPWGLYDMHGNVAEWTLDQFIPDFYRQFADKPATDPLAEPTKLYPRVVRGGSWRDPAELLRSAARVGSSPSWKEQDPQIPKSIWYHTDADFVGFRVVRPWRAPSKPPATTPAGTAPDKNGPPPKHDDALSARRP